MNAKPFEIWYLNGRPDHYADSLQDAIAYAALQDENVEFTPAGFKVRIHIGTLTLGWIRPNRGTN